MRLGRHAKHARHEFQGGLVQIGLLRGQRIAPMADALTQYWTALGFSTAVWSALELVLDTQVQLIRKHYGGTKIEPEVPRGLKQTISFLKRSFNGLESLQPFSSQTIKLLDQVTLLSERRHMIVHGAAVGFISAQGISLRRLRNAKTTYTASEQTISVSDIYAIGNETAPIVAELSKLGVILLAPYPGSVFEDSEC